MKIECDYNEAITVGDLQEGNDTVLITVEFFDGGDTPSKAHLSLDPKAQNLLLFALNEQIKRRLARHATQA